MLLQKRILVCPLNWGLGHATRCIPIIRLLVENGAKVIIAADGRPLYLLKTEFPNLDFIELKGYNINYPKKGSMVLKMVASVPSILWGIYTEHQALKIIISNYKIDAVISDNRFGLWNKKVKSVFITHQLMIKSPFAENLLRRINYYFIKKYDECWVPDVEGKTNLSGDLSHKYTRTSSTYFIGLLSRFKKKTTSNSSSYKYDIMAIVSGPEPQRTLFENILIEQLKQTTFSTLIVCGKPEIESERKTINSIETISHLNAIEMEEAIINSKLIIARSGYSTIMDLAVLEKKCILIPTPGQTEQEYLANKLKNENRATVQQQTNFNLKEGLKNSEKTTELKLHMGNGLLESRINFLLNN